MTDASKTKAVGPIVDHEVLNAARALIDGGQRRLLGIVGAPAAGKSTLTDALVEALGEHAQSVPMDGFHLSQHQLARLGRSERKGAPDTFDSAGYWTLLRRIRCAFADQETVYAPGFYRDIEEPIAASLAVDPQTRLVITEGNYLLLAEPPWPDVATLLDEIWYLDIDTELREQRLMARHMRFGRSEIEARAWMATTDRPNAEFITACAPRADRRLRWDDNHIFFDASHNPKGGGSPQHPLKK